MSATYPDYSKEEVLKEGEECSPVKVFQPRTILECTISNCVKTQDLPDIGHDNPMDCIPEENTLQSYLSSATQSELYVGEATHPSAKTPCEVLNFSNASVLPST